MPLEPGDWKLVEPKLSAIGLDADWWRKADQGARLLAAQFARALDVPGLVLRQGMSAGGATRHSAEAYLRRIIASLNAARGSTPYRWRIRHHQRVKEAASAELRAALRKAQDESRIYGDRLMADHAWRRGKANEITVVLRKYGIVETDCTPDDISKLAPNLGGAARTSDEILTRALDLPKRNRRPRARRPVGQ